MQLGFFTVLPPSGDRTHYRFAEYLIASSRRVMPDVTVTQFTDRESPVVDGIDHVERVSHGSMALQRCAAFGSVEGNWLFVDTDCVIQQDVRDVFDQPFDVALTDRNWPHLRDTEGLTRRMPYNAGVVFSRSPQFWKDVYHEVLSRPGLKPFMADQWAIGEVARSGRYRIAVLPGVSYNYPPAVSGDDPVMCRRLKPKAAIVHYKGSKRKRLLMREVAA